MEPQKRLMHVKFRGDAEWVEVSVAAWTEGNPWPKDDVQAHQLDWLALLRQREEEWQAHLRATRTSRGYHPPG